MRVTRIVYLLIVVAGLALNGLGLLDHFGHFRAASGIVPAALIFNLLVLPIGLYAAYRLGEIAEEHYRREMTGKPRSKPVAPAASGTGNKPPAGQTDHSK